MNWKEFLEEYILRTMSDPKVFEEYYMEQIVELARKAWKLIQVSEFYESSGGEYEQLYDLSAMAQKALEVSKNKAQWIAINESGEVCAYDIKPTIKYPGPYWGNSNDKGLKWYVGTVIPPDNYTRQLYEISLVATANKINFDS